jgi:hypothetical protein
MDNKLNYQQARQVRERSIKDLIADELIRGKGVGGAIKGAIGLRTEARIKGIKEKFDPLNIVKFLTFGSRLGPALYGRLFGRSRKDIEYFTGRASAIGERNKKITGLPGGGDDTTGMKVVLNQILSFLQKSHEDDMVLREKENNLRESAKLDDDRRHNELLKALGGVGGGTGTAEKVKTGGGLLDGIMSIINGFRNQIQSIIDDFKNIKNILTGFSWISKLSWMARFANPYALAAALVAAGLFAIYNHNKDIQDAAASGDVEKLKGFFANSSGTEADMYGVDSGYNKESVRNALQEAANKGSEKAQEALANFDKLTTDTSPAKTEKQLMDEYLYSKKGFYDAGNGNYKHINDPNKKPTKSDFDAAKEYANQKLQNTSGATVLPPPAGTPPPVVNETPKSAEVSNVTNTNLDLELDKTTAGRNQVLQDRTNVVNQKAAGSQRVPMHFVRNKDATFQRMIYNSTRLV